MPDFYKAGRSLRDRNGVVGLNDDGINEVPGVDAGVKAAGDLRKLFLGQLMQLPVQGFNFLFQGVQFLYGFHGGLLSMQNVYKTQYF